MNIIAIDDDPVSLSVLEWVIRQSGHRAISRLNPLEAVADFQPGVDLVISDVNMPGLDGFDIAQKAAELIGSYPPPTLLVSGLHQQDRMDAVPPTQIIGLIAKPIPLGHMHRVIAMIGRTRKACPGVVGDFCPLRCHAKASSDPLFAQMDAICNSSQYARCPHYNEQAGRELRAWVSDPKRSGTTT